MAVVRIYFISKFITNVSFSFQNNIKCFCLLHFNHWFKCSAFLKYLPSHSISIIYILEIISCLFWMVILFTLSIIFIGLKCTMSRQSTAAIVILLAFVNEYNDLPTITTLCVCWRVHKKWKVWPITYSKLNPEWLFFRNHICMYCIIIIYYHPIIKDTLMNLV